MPAALDLPGQPGRPGEIHGDQHRVRGEAETKALMDEARGMFVEMRKRGEM